MRDSDYNIVPICLSTKKCPLVWFTVPATPGLSSTIVHNCSPHVHELACNVACTCATQLAHKCTSVNDCRQHKLRYVAQVTLHESLCLSIQVALVNVVHCQPVLHDIVDACNTSCECVRYTPTNSPQCPTTHHNHAQVSTQHRTIVIQETHNHHTISIVL